MFRRYHHWSTVVYNSPDIGFRLKFLYTCVNFFPIHFRPPPSLPPSYPTKCINREEPLSVTVRRQRNRTVGSISAGRLLRVRALRDRKQETPHKENKQPKYIPNAVRRLTTLFHHRSLTTFSMFFCYFSNLPARRARL